MYRDLDIKVIIATHKKYRMPTDGMYLPVHVGAAGKDSIENYQCDDEGENISSFNPYFSELTGLYWAWKNLDADYIGLVHYRRHFASRRTPDPWAGILKRSDIEKDLGSIRVFVPLKRRYWIESLYSHYAHTHHIFQLDETRTIIAEKYPEYLGSFDKAVTRRWGCNCNFDFIRRFVYHSLHSSQSMEI